MMTNPILRWTTIVGIVLGACAALVTGASWYARVAVGGGAAEELGVPETSLAQIPAWAGMAACVVALGALVLVVARPASDLRVAVAVVPAAIVGFVTGFRGPVLLLPVVGAVLVLVVERLMRSTIPERDRRGVVPGSDNPLPTGPVDVEEAVAARVYPYPRPLPEPAKSQHVAAVGAWQKRFVPWLGLGFAGVLILYFSVSRGRFADPGDPLIYWNPEPVVGAVVMYGCGLALIGISAAGGRRAVLARFRHARLLSAYGVPLGVRGRPRGPKDPDRGPGHRESPRRRLKFDKRVAYSGTWSDKLTQVQGSLVMCFLAVAAGVGAVVSGGWVGLGAAACWGTAGVLGLRLWYRLGFDVHEEIHIADRLKWLLCGFGLLLGGGLFIGLGQLIGA